MDNHDFSTADSKSCFPTRSNAQHAMVVFLRLMAFVACVLIPLIVACTVLLALPRGDDLGIAIVRGVLLGFFEVVYVGWIAFMIKTGASWLLPASAHVAEAGDGGRNDTGPTTVFASIIRRVAGVFVCLPLILVGLLCLCLTFGVIEIGRVNNPAKHRKQAARMERRMERVMRVVDWCGRHPRSVRCCALPLGVGALGCSFILLRGNATARN